LHFAYVLVAGREKINCYLRGASGRVWLRTGDDEVALKPSNETTLALILLFIAFS
jgi:hypothetical protein